MRLKETKPPSVLSHCPRCCIANFFLRIAESSSLDHRQVIKIKPSTLTLGTIITKRKKEYSNFLITTTLEHYDLK